MWSRVAPTSLAGKTEREREMFSQPTLTGYLQDVNAGFLFAQGKKIDTVSDTEDDIVGT